MPDFQCLTLVRRNPFHWRREPDGTIVVRKERGGPRTARFTAEQYGAVVNLIASRPEGTQLGALADGDVPADSLGRLLSGFGLPRPHASWIAAVAVDEGYADHEYRGNRNGGLWLFPVEQRAPTADDEAVREAVGTRDEAGDPGLDTRGTVAGLRELADRLESAPAAETRHWCIDLADAMAGREVGQLESIAAWERKVEGASYVYRFDVEDHAMAGLCVDALSAAKARNVGGRRFSRVNRDAGRSGCLYVGSSRRLVTRIHQHLGLAHAGTYALQIAHWRPAEALTGTLRLRVFRLPPEVDADVVQALEDGLWRAARPLFGRLGGR